jgi:hypothetical protein
MSNPKDGKQGRIKETKKCLYCGDLMSETDVPGIPVNTKGFVCPKCGFVASFVRTDVDYYYGVSMKKEREGLSFYEEVQNITNE